MLESLKDKITSLIALYEGERQRADSLAEKLAKVEAAADSYSKQITVLNRQISNLKLQGAFTSDSGNAVAKASIEKLIRDIDKCIDYLEC